MNIPKKGKDPDAPAGAENPNEEESGAETSQKKSKQTIEGPIGNISDISIQSTGGARSKKRDLTLSTNKPGQGTFFSCCPSVSMTTDIFGLEVKIEGSTSKELYPVMPSVVYGGQFEMELIRDCKEVRVTPWVDRKNRVGLWCMKLTPGKWSSTALDALSIAKDGWIRLIPNMDQGWFEIEEPLADWDVPDWEKLLAGRTLEDLLNLGFKDRIIQTENHQVINDLYGTE